MRVSIKTAIVAAVTAIALVPGVAQAQSYNHIDAAGDMFDLSGVPLPTVTNGDIVGLSVNYTKKSLTLVTTLTAIDTSGTNGLSWVADVSSRSATTPSVWPPTQLESRRSIGRVTARRSAAR